MGDINILEDEVLIKDKLYNYFVRKNGRVWYEYERYVREHMEEHRTHKFRHLKVLFKLNWFYRVKKGNTPYLYWDVPLNASEKKNSIKQSCRLYPESIIYKREDIDVFIEKMLKYDVICFDCFDTLLFRTVNNPIDLFYLLEVKYKVPGFKSLRIQALKEAREKYEKKEVTLNNIYEIISKYCSNSVTALDEMDMEYQVTYANKYFLKIVKKLITLNKEVVCISDMYLSNDEVNNLLVAAGYPTIKVFTSSSEGVTKKTGELQKKVIKLLGEAKKYIMIGDNYESDFIQSKDSGMDVYWYKSCQDIGNSYRSTADKSIGGSAYMAVVNNYLHCGSQKILNPYYEHGFTYGGIITYGFCKFIENLRERDKYDKFIFLARDMEIFYKAYKKFFNSIACEYALFSRFSSQQLILEFLPEEYLNYTIFTRINKNTIAEALQIYDLPEFKDKLQEKGIDENEKLTTTNYEYVKEIIYENKELITNLFKPAVETAKVYYKNIIGKSQNICILDLGWKGTAVLYLSRLFKEWGWNVKVHGAIVSMSGNVYAQSVYDSKILDVYMKRSELDFTAGVPAKSNFETFRGHMFEATFTSKNESLLEFGKQNNDYIFARKNPNEFIIRQIQEGILDFCGEFLHRTHNISEYCPITGFSANTPINKALKTKSYTIPIWGYVLDEASSEPGFSKEPKYKTFFQVMKQCNLANDHDLSSNLGVIEEGKVLYICSTYSQLLITIITVITEKKENVDIILYDDLPNCCLLRSRLRKINIFNNIIIFTKKDLPPRFHDAEHNKKRLMQLHYAHLIAVEKKMIVDIMKYEEVYTFYDGHHLGLYLQEKHIKYHLIEDGMNHFQHIMATPSVREVPIVNSKSIKGYLKGVNYLCCGQNPDCLSIEVNENKNLAITHKNIIEKPRKAMFSLLSENEKNHIFEVFLEDLSFIDNIKNDLAIVFTSVLVNDGWVNDEKTQIRIYRDIIDKLKQEGYYVILKPHPRDKVLYTKEFRDCYIMDKDFPSELLDFKGNLHFKKGVVIASSAMELINCIEIKEKLGFKFLRNYKEAVAPWVLESLAHPETYNW